MRLDLLARHPAVLRALLHRPDCDLAALTCDSRRADPATAFFALQGLRDDGHRYLGQALAAGSPAVFVSEPHWYERLASVPGSGLAGVFLVARGRPVLAALAAQVYGAPSHGLTLYGVTGTNGKTTVTHLAAQLSGALGRPCAIIGSLGLIAPGGDVESPRTTPEAPEAEAFLRHCLHDGTATAAMEVSSIGIVLERSGALRFRAAAFTNVTQDHLDFHATMDAYREAKFRLFHEYDLGTAVINLDDPAGRLLEERLRQARPDLPRTTFALDGPADLAMAAAETRAEGMRGVLLARGQRAPFETPLLGRFNLSNLLAATGLLLAGGHPLDAIAAAIPLAKGARGRFEPVPIGRPFRVLVDYAHSPDALENVLVTARGITAGRLHVVFGCGGDRDRLKRPLMGAIAERLADRVVLTSDNPRSEPPANILAEIERGLSRARTRVRTIADRREAIGHALAEARPGDLVLIAGKGHETYQEIDGRRLPFDDREVVRAWAGL
ncbi:MAG: UDP-N-acetylmuramoyl-L-alanyl-D-glutamate--2,6-diaminopimelate ligase [Candidatus Lambdaproteobacteria bacterium]|nr:UDP-N-acetylmuramoyl-L-alanyl-D-glutamate--2,6-diaminopimelate ligase [Candidatus Lambdaproteobacteria bacterium]